MLRQVLVLERSPLAGRPGASRERTSVVWRRGPAATAHDGRWWWAAGAVLPRPGQTAGRLRGRSARTAATAARPAGAGAGGVAAGRATAAANQESGRPWRRGGVKIVGIRRILVVTDGVIPNTAKNEHGSEEIAWLQR